MLAELDRKAVKRAGVQALQEALDDELRAQIEPRDLADDFGLEVFFDGGHGRGEMTLTLSLTYAGRRRAGSTSPLSIGFSTMWRASAANSAGLPRRGGNGTCDASPRLLRRVSAATIAVSNTPGAIDMMRMPSLASSRAMRASCRPLPALLAE